jgi:glycosyltransferase involved in cell wall biosynthesis
MSLSINSISVIICSWQAPPSLDETLDSVFRQEADVNFEVVLVNNGFSQSRADQLKAAYPELRILDEPTPGLAHARCTGFRVAQGDFFVCIDDDNFLEEGFLSSLANLISKFPNLGCISPVVLPRWEQAAPAKWLQEYGLSCLSYNALEKPGTERKERLWTHPDFGEWRCPAGGGMIIHRSIAEKYLATAEEKRLKFGRVGSSLGGCEDVDIVYRLPFVGRDAAYSENLILYHLIPASRLQMKYLFRLAFRSAQDWAVFQRLLQKEKHPFAVSDFKINFCEFFRLPYVWFRVLLRTRCSQSRFFLEWAAHAGLLLGLVRDLLGDLIPNLYQNWIFRIRILMGSKK